MKLRNVLRNKKYKTYNSWIKDLLEDLKNEYKLHRKNIAHRPGLLNLGDYTESLAVGLFIKWFLQNYFDEEE